MFHSKAFDLFTLSKSADNIITGKRHLAPMGSQLLATACIYALCGTSPAHAIDSIEFFESLKKKVEAAGSTLTYESLTKTGDDGARATNLELFNPNKNRRLKIATLEVAGGEGENLETFSFDSLDANQLEMTIPENSNDTVLTIERISATDFKAGAGDGTGETFWPFDMGTGRAETIRLVSKGESNVAWNMPSIEINGLKQQGAKAFSLDTLFISASSGSVASTNTETGINGDFTQGEISLSNWEVFPGNGFQLGLLEIGNGSFEGVNPKDQKVSFTYNGAKLESMYTPDLMTNEAIAFPKVDGIATIGSMQLSLDGTPMLSIGGLQSKTEFDEGTKELSSSGSIDDLFIDVKSFPVEGEQAAQLKPFFDLGYENINMDMAVEVSWNVETGDLALPMMRYAADNVGAMDLTLKVNGYTTEVARKIQTIATKISEAPDENVKQALLLQLLAEAASLTVEELTYTLNDQSITRRVMEMQAAKSGQEPKDLIAAMPFMAGAVLSQLQVPEFAASASAAISTFMSSAMSDKASITLAAKPESPVSVAEIMGMAAGVQAGNVAPAEIIEKFNVTVSAE